MADARITYGYLWRLALSESIRREARLEVYGDDPEGRTALEKQGFERIMGLLNLYEENEADFLRVVETKRERVLALREIAAAAPKKPKAKQ